MFTPLFKVFINSKAVVATVFIWEHRTLEKSGKVKNCSTLCQ